MPATVKSKAGPSLRQATRPDTVSAFDPYQMARAFLAAIPRPSPTKSGLIWIPPKCWRRWDNTIQSYRDMSLLELRAAMSWFLEETYIARADAADPDADKPIVRPAMVTATIEAISGILLAGPFGWLDQIQFLEDDYNSDVGGLV